MGKWTGMETRDRQERGQLQTSGGKSRQISCMIFGIGNRNSIKMTTKEMQVEADPEIPASLTSCTIHVNWQKITEVKKRI